MQKPILHFVVEPFCGWCYGAGSLFNETLNSDHFTIQVHLGGMITGNNIQKNSVEFKQYVLQTDPKVAQATGCEFGQKYIDSLNEFEAWLNSEPPSRAVLASEKLGLSPLKILKEIQSARFLEGRRIDQFETLQDIAEDNGLNPIAFRAAYNSVSALELRAHFENSRQKLMDIKGNGFPSAAMEYPDGTISPIEMNLFYGNPKGKVPALEFANGETLTECSAILLFLADENPESKLAPNFGTLERAHLHEYLNFISSEIHKLFPPFFSDETDIENQKVNEKEITRQLAHFETLFKDERPYILGKCYSVADPYLFVILRWVKEIGMELSFWPQLSKFKDRMENRATVQYALQAEAITK